MKKIIIKALSEKGKLALMEGMIPKSRKERLGLKLAKIEIHKVLDEPLTFHVICNLPGGYYDKMLEAGYLDMFKGFCLEMDKDVTINIE